MTAERNRIEFLIARDGRAATREWVRRTLEIYRAALANRASHASTSDYRQSFETAVREFEGWLEGEGS